MQLETIAVQFLSASCRASMHIDDILEDLEQALAAT